MRKTCVKAILILLGIGITSAASASWWEPDSITAPSPRDFPTSTANIQDSLVSSAQDKLGSIKKNLKNKTKGAVTKAHSKLTAQTKNKVKKVPTNAMNKSKSKVKKAMDRIKKVSSQKRQKI